MSHIRVFQVEKDEDWSIYTPGHLSHLLRELLGKQILKKLNFLLKYAKWVPATSALFSKKRLELKAPKTRVYMN